MTKPEHLYLKLMEECAEVQQRVSKLMQFGADEKEPGQELTNAQRLRQEINDLLAIVEFLEDGELIPKLKPDELRRHINGKYHKLAKYLAYSQSLGLVEK